MTNRGGELRAQLDPGRLRAELEALPAPRDAGSAASAAAVELIRRGFLTAGWNVRVDEFPVPLPGGTGRNVVATRTDAGSGPPVLVVAHHDTVPGTGGADDNGSGVIALLTLARLLADAPGPVVLAAVDHEESGFLGSRRLVGQLGGPIRGAVVLEMLGYTDQAPGSQRLPPAIGLLYPRQIRRIVRRGRRGDFTAVLYRGSSRPLARRFATALAALPGSPPAALLRAPTDLPLIGPLLARLVPFARDFGRSDHVPFWEAQLPAIQLTDTANFRNPHYHRPADRPGTLDYERLADVVAATAATVEAVAGSRP